MSGDVFESWLRKSFIPHVSSLRKPVFLFFDSHGSHLTYATVKAAMDDQIIICLPPHTSHALQSLDVAVFKPLKGKWRTILLRFYRETRMKSADKGSFPVFLKQLWEKKSASHLVGGFRGSGLWPFNPNAIRDSKNGQYHVSASSEPQPGPSSQEESAVNTLRKLLCKTIIETIAPPMSHATKDAVANSNRKRKRVQAKAGEVLTSSEVLKRLEIEEEDGQKKQRQHWRRCRQQKNLSDLHLNLIVNRQMMMIHYANNVEDTGQLTKGKNLKTG